MFSAAQMKAPNATIPYISSHICAKKNGTLEWLKMKPPTTESFNKVIRVAGEIRNTRKVAKDALMRALRKRIREKQRKRSEKSRNNLQKVLNSLARSKNYARESVEEVLPDYVEEIDTVILFLSGEAEDQSIVHNWAEGEEYQTVPYNGRLGAFAVKKKKPGYPVTYWKSEETHAEGEETFMYAAELACDYLLGDLVLV
jgi:hypothetical protein